MLLILLFKPFAIAHPNYWTIVELWKYPSQPYVLIPFLNSASKQGVSFEQELPQELHYPWFQYGEHFLEFLFLQIRKLRQKLFTAYIYGWNTFYEV